MAIPSCAEIRLPLLRLVQRHGEVRLRDAAEWLAEEFKLTEQDLALRYSGGVRAFNYRVGWAKNDLTVARLLKSTGHGVFAITPHGEDVLRSPPQIIDNNYLRRFPEFTEYIRKGVVCEKTSDDVKEDETLRVEERGGQGSGEKDAAPEEVIHAAHAELENALAHELLVRILEQSPGFFERLTVRLLVAMGYGGSVEEAGKVLGKSHDGGVDGVIKQDELGLSRIYVQAKRYENSQVGSSAIRDFSGALTAKRATSGVFITTSTFSQEAKETAKDLQGKQRIALIDGKELVRLMIRHGVGCREEETLVIKKLDEDFFEEL